jgi:2',3'-cyclic-nucleotide 2'-phosphodiesterase (5'-nucleotidase family)
MENASVPLAAIDGIDALMTGHNHLVFPGGKFAGIDGVDGMRARFTANRRRWAVSGALTWA